MNETYKEGDIYPDWKKLKTLPENKNAKELGVQEGNLFVFMDVRDEAMISELEHAKGGLVLRLTKDDRSISPYFSNNTKEFFTSFYRLALLPTNLSIKSKSSKPTIEIVQNKIVKFSDSETQYSEDGIDITIKGENGGFDKVFLTPEKARELAKQINREIARHKNIKF